MGSNIVQTVEKKLRQYPNVRAHTPDLRRLWREVIERTLEESLPDHRRAMELRYFEKLPEQEVLDALPVARNTFLKWRSGFVASVAIKAAYFKLIQP